MDLDQIKEFYGYKYVPDVVQDQELIELENLLSEFWLINKPLVKAFMAIIGNICLRRFIDSRFNTPNVDFLKQILIRTFLYILKNSLRDGKIEEEA